MIMKTFKYKKIFSVFAAAAITVGLTSSCSLDEVNPGGFTYDNIATSETGYDAILNNIYFGAERFYYGTDSYVLLTEGDTDLWTYMANKNSAYQQYLWFFAGASPNTTYTNGFWNASYDGIGACNIAIAEAPSSPYKGAELNEKIAEARFMRAIYYFNLVEQFGAVTMLTEPTETPNYTPTRTDPMTIYKEVIIPDLQYAVDNLNVGTDATCTTPTKKAALGFLAKACLQTYEYGSTDYLQTGYDAAKKLITDCESGGATYGAYMYPTYDDVFAEANNQANKEALWKHRWYAGTDGHGSSNGNWKLNRNNEYFLCGLSNFGARVDNQASRLTWEGSQEGVMMPTQHLLNLYVQADGTMDPRFHKSFSTQWNANNAYKWSDADVNKFDKTSDVSGQSLAVGDLAVKFIMPQDNDYATEKASKHTSKYLVIDYADVYNDSKHNVNMNYAYTNTSDTYKSDGSNENLFRYFYPSLNKFNSSNYYVANANKKRNGNLNAILIMRMAEVYLIAAELDLYLNNNTTEALAYINKIRTRAGAEPLTGTPTVRTILDERARELCGEHTRFMDLHRTGMLKDATYLTETHPDLAQYFKPEYALRPISTTFTATITNGAEYQNPGY
jgi:hypothetical protein